MKNTVFLRILFTFPEWEAFRRVKQNAKTNNKALPNRGPFLLITKGNTMTSENPLLALRENQRAG